MLAAITGEILGQHPVAGDQSRGANIACKDLHEAFQTTRTSAWEFTVGGVNEKSPLWLVVGAP